ncbi:MAG: hypothetical protein RLZZ399_1034 [Verrucomicrobiota bacterium]|jgi:Zn-dependent protease with chaperone function
MKEAHPYPGIPALWFDGTSAAGKAVTITREAQNLVVESAGPVPFRYTWSWRQVRWPERTQSGNRLAHLPDGSSLESADSAAWDAWMRACQAPESWVVRLQQTWSGAAICMLLVVLACFAAYSQGLPSIARKVAHHVPESVEKQLGKTALDWLDGTLLRPSALSMQEQDAWRERLRIAVESLPSPWIPEWNLEFRKSDALGPNAFALHGGTLVITDELLAMAGMDTEMVLGVMGHELGHLRHHHGTQAIVQSSALGILCGLLWGDFSGLVAAVPMTLGHAAYSRDAEREADAASAELMDANAISPLAMVRFFDALEQDPKFSENRQHNHGVLDGIAISIASHPPNKERRAFFREAALRRHGRMQAPAKRIITLQIRDERHHVTEPSLTAGEPHRRFLLSV